MEFQTDWDHPKLRLVKTTLKFKLTTQAHLMMPGTVRT